MLIHKNGNIVYIELKKYIFFEVNRLNFILVYLLSFRNDVYTLKFSSLWIKLKLKKVKLLNWYEHAKIDEVEKYRNQAAIIYINSKKNSEKNHSFSFWGIDFTDKVVQELALTFEKLYVLHSIQKNKYTFLVKDFNTVFLFNYRPNIKQNFDKSFDTTISFINYCLDFLSIYIKLSARILYHLLFLFRNILKKEKLITEEFVLNHSVNPNEASFDKNKRTFLWMEYSRNDNQKNFFYFLPPVFQKYTVELDLSGVLYAIGLKDLVKYLCIQKRVRLILSLIGLLLVLPLSLLNRKLIFLYNYKFELLFWNYFLKGKKVKTYLTSLSSIGNELPIVVLLNNLGVNTCMYMYGVNSFNYKKTIPFESYYVIFSSILCSTIYCWHKKFKDFILKHEYTGNLQINGPLMAGIEKFDFSIKKDIIGNQRKNDFLITIFDIPPVDPDSKMILHSEWPDYNTEENVLQFYLDFEKLLNEIGNVVLLCKPKRSHTSGKFMYSKEIKEFFLRSEVNDRIIILEDDINPWIPPLISNLTICMPFTSPAIVAYCKEKSFYYYDPNKNCIFHDYHELLNHIIYDYNDLKKRIEELMIKPKNSLNIIKNTPFYCSESDGGFVNNFLKQL